MWLGLAELRRQPMRFLPVTLAMTGLVVLLVILAGFLDGLELGQTGPYRAHEGLLIVVSDDADDQLMQSTVTEATWNAVRGVDGVADSGPLDSFATTLNLTDDDELVDVIVYGYSVATATLPDPPNNGVIVDGELGNRVRGDLLDGASVQIGPAAEPFIVDKVVPDLTAGSPTVWLRHDDWTTLVRSASPATAPADGVHTAIIVAPGNGVSLDQLSTRITAEVDGVRAITVNEAISALPVVQQQSTTFEGIIGMTFAVTLMVVALFFALLALERARLFAVLKAVGAKTSDLIFALGTQAVVISVVSIVLGVTISFVFVSLLPAELPLRLELSRIATVAVGTVVTALLGSLTTLRRLASIDPGSAIG